MMKYKEYIAIYGNDEESRFKRVAECVKKLNLEEKVKLKMECRRDIEVYNYLESGLVLLTLILTMFSTFTALFSEVIKKDLNALYAAGGYLIVVAVVASIIWWLLSKKRKCVYLLAALEEINDIGSNSSGTIRGSFLLPMNVLAFVL